MDKQLSTLIKLSNESRYLVEVSLVPIGRPCCWVRVVSKLGPSCLRLGSDSSWVRKIPRVRVVLGPSCPATIDPRGVAKFDPGDMIGTIYEEEH